MKTRIILICAIAFAICLALWLRRTTKPEMNTSTQSEVTLTNQQPASQPEPPKVVGNRGASNTLRVMQLPSTATPLAAQALAAWQGSIEFYGKVIDENSNAVPGAHISFRWVEIPDETGNRTAVTESDAAGLFALHGKRGLDLGVSVSKEGYYSSRRDNDSFTYGSLRGESFSPDSQNPVVFHLLKKGKAEPLIHIAGIGLHTMRDYLLAADGKPTEVSLHDGRLTPAGQEDLNVEFQAGPPLDNFPSRINWQCQVTIPGGGLIQTDEEFPFLAPENGYQASDGWSITATNWTEQVNMQYYVKLRDGNFGRVKLRVIGVPGRAYFRMESFLNPSGSRNLEPAN